MSTHDFRGLKRSDFIAECKCQCCGVEFDPVPGAMQYNLCSRCERGALSVQVNQAIDKLSEIKQELKQIHAHGEWDANKVRAEVYNIIIKHLSS